jgi:diguanylate cyclase (GGDEF)-like protein/PAS domain S-box-containing protein
LVDELTHANPRVVTLLLVALFLVGELPLVASVIAGSASRTVLPIATASWLLGLGLALALLVSSLLGRIRAVSEELRSSSESSAVERDLLLRERVARSRAEHELQAAQTTLRAMELRIRTLLSNIPAAILAYDASGAVTAADGGALAGLTDQPLVGRSARDLAEWHPAAAEHVRRALAGEEFTAVEQLRDHRIETRYVPLRQDTIVVGALAVSIDLRERDRAARAVREADERFRRLFENAPVAAVVVAPDGGVLLANPAFGEMLGFTATDLSKLSFHELTHPDDRELDAALHERLLRGEIPSYTVEKRLRRKDGGMLPLEVIATVVRDAEGRALYGVRLLRGRPDDELVERYTRYDALTRLPNRLLLEERLERAVAHALSVHQRLALVAFDVDNLGVIVDRLGSAAGDQLLRELPMRLRDVLGDGDLLACVGRHEFALVLPGRGAAGAAELVEKLLAELQDGITLDGQQIHPELRLGFAMFPEDAADAEQLLRRADAALLVAKRSGRRYTRYAEGVLV